MLVILHSTAVVDASSAITAGSAYASTTVKQLYKSGNVVTLEIRGTVTCSNGATLATIGSGYRPKTPFFIASSMNNASTQPVGLVLVYNNGSVLYFGSSLNAAEISITATYII